MDKVVFLGLHDATRYCIGLLRKRGKMLGMDKIVFLFLRFVFLFRTIKKVVVIVYLQFS